jgi:hypothetical protein
MSLSFIDAIQHSKHGLVKKNTLFLPFHMELMYIWIGKDMSLLSIPDIITDFYSLKAEINVHEDEKYTQIVFLKHSNLHREFDHYKGHIIFHCAEKGADIFLKENRHFIKISFHGDTETIFFELIDNPLNL